ncbi:hypothetical protein ACI782_10110 [Geodermatophilus sp. SYSU D00703]
MLSDYVTGAKRIVAVGPSSVLGVRDDDQPAGVAHAVLRPADPGQAVSVCGTEVVALPGQDWQVPTVGVLRCEDCEQLAA